MQVVQEVLTFNSIWILDYLWKQFFVLFFFSRCRLLWNPETFSLLPGIITANVLYVSWFWLWDCSLTHSQSGFITITVKKKKGAADLTKQTWTTAGLTAVYYATRKRNLRKNKTDFKGPYWNWTWQFLRVGGALVLESVSVFASSKHFLLIW